MPAWGNLEISDLSNRGVTFDINAAGNVVAHNQDLETIVVALPAAAAGATGPLSLASVAKIYLGTILVNGSEVIGVNAAPVTATTLNGTITNSQTTIGVTTNVGMAKSDILLIGGSEQVQISGATGFIGSTGLVVTRGYNSTSGAATGVNASVQDLTLNVTRGVGYPYGLGTTTPAATGINVPLTVTNVDFNNVTGNSVLLYDGTSVVFGATGTGYEYIVENVTGAPFQTTTLNANIAATGVNANGIQIGVVSTTGINVSDVLIIGATGGVSGEKVFVTAINGSTGLTVNRALFTAGGATGAGATVKEVSSILVTSIMNGTPGFLGATGSGSAGIGATGSLTAYVQQKPAYMQTLYDTSVSTSGVQSSVGGRQYDRSHVYGVSVIEQQLGRTGATGVGSPAYIAGVTASSYKLNGTITTGQTQIGLATTVGINPGDTLLIGAAEQVLVGATGFIGSTGLLVTRAQNGTSAAATGVNANVTDITLTGGRSYSSASTGYTRHPAHAGWVLQKDGAGGPASITMGGATGTLYNGVPTVYFGTTGPNNAAVSQLKAGIAATGALTTFPVTTSNNIFAGDTIQVDTEKMLALFSSGTGGNQQYVTVTRGYLGTTIASHASGAFITDITSGASGVAVLGSTGSTGMGVASITITYPGMYAVNAPLVTLSGTVGTGATGFAQTGTVVMGGRFGRKMYETLVAMPDISGDVESVQFPNV